MARAPWYDPDHPDELHADLQSNYAAAVEIVNRRPATQRHFAACAVCQQIRDARTASPPPLATRNRLKLKITAAKMHELLGLPPGHEILYMWAEPDPNAVFIILAGEDLPAVADGDPAPQAGADLPQAA